MISDLIAVACIVASVAGFCGFIAYHYLTSGL
jgi:hypothetical protein